MKVTNLVRKLLNGMESAIEWAIAILIGSMVLNITAGVFFRYVLGNSIYWTEEMGRYLMIWAGLLGAVLAMKGDEHVGISMAVELFPVGVRWWLNLLARLIVSVFLAVILAKSFVQLGSLSIQRSSAMEIPMIVPYLSVTVSVILMSVENLGHIARLFLKPVKATGGNDAPAEGK